MRHGFFELVVFLFELLVLLFHVLELSLGRVKLVFGSVQFIPKLALSLAVVRNSLLAGLAAVHERLLVSDEMLVLLLQTFDLTLQNMVIGSQLVVMLFESLDNLRWRRVDPSDGR